MVIKHELKETIEVELSKIEIDDLARQTNNIPEGYVLKTIGRKLFSGGNIRVLYERSITSTETTEIDEVE